jgi:hypothetical protein
MQLDQRLENRRVIGASDWSKAQERERPTAGAKS